MKYNYQTIKPVKINEFWLKLRYSPYLILIQCAENDYYPLLPISLENRKLSWCENARSIRPKSICKVKLSLPEKRSLGNYHPRSANYSMWIVNSGDILRGYIIL